MATSSPINNSGYKNLSLALLNINGLRNNIPDIQYIIACDQVHVVALCETKLDSSVPDSKVYLEGFRMWRRDRNRFGGGVALYVQDHIKTRLRSDLIKTQVEMIWVEMELPGSRPVLLGCCYRPPNATVEYLNQIKDMMTLVSKEEKDILLMGDFNVDWKSEDRKKTSFMSDLGLSQIVEDFTRVDTDAKTQTCIDHIYTNIPEQCFTPQSFATGCSDHNLVTVTVKKNIPQWVRRSNQFDQNKFKEDIQKLQWTNVCKEPDPKEALSKFTEMFLSVADKHAPLQIQDICRSLRLDWMTETLIVERDKAKKDRITRNHLDVCESEEGTPMLDDKRQEQENDSERWRRLQEHILRKREKMQKESLQQELEEASRYSKKVLKMFKACLGESFPSRVISLTPDGDVTSEADHVVNLHQTNTGTTDPECVSEGSQVQQIRQAGLEAFSFREIDADTVHGWLVHLCDHVIYEIDQTEAKMMKLAADHISGPISHILNKFIKHKDFPAELQIFPFSSNKYSYSRQNNKVDNIHITVGLIFDSILSLQIKQFFNDKVIPSATDEDKIKQIQTDWLAAADGRKTVQVVFLDFSSLFQSISHDLLINDLRTYGFSDSALCLIKGFLSYHKVSCGLPPISFLTGVLFTIFLNDHRSILTHSSAALSNNHLMVYYTAEDHGRLEANKQFVLKWAEKKQVRLNDTILTKTLPNKSTTLRKCFDFLLSSSVLRCPQFNLNWIQGLKVILLFNDSWKNEFDQILKKLQQRLGKKCLDAIPEEVKDSVINSLVLIELWSRPGEKASSVDLTGFLTCSPQAGGSGPFGPEPLDIRTVSDPLLLDS